MLEFYENKSHKKYLKCCRIFSKTALEDQPLSEIFEDNDIEAFIKSLINIQCFKYIYDGKYCLVILIMLLKED